jgi:threonine/homoserine/homoserine lactone efflux protein
MQLSWAGYSTFVSTFVGFVLLLIIAPGPDFAVVMKNALAIGRARRALDDGRHQQRRPAQGTAAALGLGAVIVASRPLHETVRWARIAYLCWLDFPVHC